MKKQLIVRSLTIITFFIVTAPVLMQVSAIGVNMPANPELGKAYESYLQLKDALVASDSKKAKTLALDLQKDLTGITAPENMLKAVKVIASSDDLKMQRMAFSTISREMISMAKKNGLGTTTYIQYCSMANNDRGAYWLSNNKEIRNPYFGDSMLKCGEVKETVNK